jgi:hypothetical protein
MKINLEEITKNISQRKKWNSVPLSEIEFFERGVKIEIPKELVDDFVTTGLNNIDFIASGYYKGVFEIGQKSNKT